MFKTNRERQRERWETFGGFRLTALGVGRSGFKHKEHQDHKAPRRPFKAAANIDQMRHVIEKSLREADELLAAFRSKPENVSKLEQIGKLILATFDDKGKILACGNGGSMADAMHFCEEWSGRFRADREPYPAIALSDPTHMSCVANDYGYEHVFSRQVRGLASKNDLLLVLSTSGNSPSIVEAAKAARDKKVQVIGFLGKDGGEALPLCDLALIAPGKTSDRIQEIHMLCLHIIIEAVESQLL